LGGNQENVDLEVFEVGGNLVEPEPENCRAVSKPQSDARGDRELSVFCGTWTRPAGSVVALEIGSTEALVNQWAESGWWRRDLNLRVVCQPGEARKILGSVNAILLNCKLRRDDFDYVALVAGVEGKIYLAEGLAAAFPALETTIGLVSGLIETTTDASTLSESAERIKLLLGNRLHESNNPQDYFRLFKLGQYYNSIERFAEEEQSYREALRIHRIAIGKGKLIPSSGNAMMQQALALSNMGRLSEADAVFSSAEVLVKDLDRIDQARFHSYLALHAANKSNLKEGIRLARVATQFRRDIAQDLQTLVAATDTNPRSRRKISQAQSADIAHSLYIEASMQLGANRLDEAQKLAIKIRKELQKAAPAPPGWEPRMLELEGDIDAARGNLAVAEKTFKEALVLRQELYRQSRPEAITHFTLAKVHLAQGRKSEALDAFKAGMDIIKVAGGGLRFNQVLPYLQTAYDEAQRDPGQRDRLHSEMFEVGQLVRGGITAKSIALAAARLSSGHPTIRKLQDERRIRDDLLKNFNFIAAQIAKLVGQTDNPAADKRMNELRQEITASERRISDFEGEVQAALPGYNQLIESTVTAAQIQGSLRSGEALVQILIGKRLSFGFLVQKDKITAYPILLSEEEVKKTVAKIRLALVPIPERPILIYPAYDVEAAHQLYRKLFEPVLAELQKIDHLITVPSNALLSLPFGMLVTQKPSPIKYSDYSKVAWLLERSAISLTPSVQSFVRLRGNVQASQAKNPFIGFGGAVPVPQKDTLPEECAEYADFFTTLPRLDDTEVELRRIASAFGAGEESLVLGNKFTESAVTQKPLNQYRVVAFATHGFLPTGLKCGVQPALLVSAPSNASDKGDVFLDASEILDLKLDADLVVLSACNTGGSGDATGGESLSGLARSFFYAGARALLVSHWYVKSESTVTLMSATFESLEDPSSSGIAYALRSAQKEMYGLARRSHPVYWAAFTLVGDGARRASLTQ
jgi:CHAT domain-containing protein